MRTRLYLRQWQGNPDVRRHHQCLAEGRVHHCRGRGGGEVTWRWHRAGAGALAPWPPAASSSHRFCYDAAAFRSWGGGAAGSLGSERVVGGCWLRHGQHELLRVRSRLERPRWAGERDGNRKRQAAQAYWNSQHPASAKDHQNRRAGSSRMGWLTLKRREERDLAESSRKLQITVPRRLEAGPCFVRPVGSVVPVV